MVIERLLRLGSGVLPYALASLALLFGPLFADAQLKQPFVFAADTAGPGPGILVFVRNDATGVLTPVPGSPFPSKGPVNGFALDFNGRFLFVATSLNNIEMYTIDPNTGALQEVPNSPFASATTKGIAFMSTENTGQFLYVIDSVGSTPNVSAVESFQIDAVNLDLIPAAVGATDLPGLFAGGATHLSGKAFYAILNQPNASGGFPADTPHFLFFDSSNGTFTFPNVLPPLSSGGVSLTLDPQGRNVALSTAGSVTIQSLQSDGTLGTSNMSVTLNATADSMSFDTLGRFLYLTFSDILSPSGVAVHIYSPSSLQELPNSPLPSTFPETRLWSLDPTAPLIYADKVYQVDPQTGIPNEILPSSPVSVPVVFGLVPGSQPVSGPSALPNPAALSFGSLTTGQTSGAQTLTISSVGGQALSLNSIAVTGANASDFSIAGSTCSVPSVLQPGVSCSLSISFSPSAAGARAASLMITDNAAPPTQSVPLSGTGVAPVPAVTLIPGSLNFGTITQGTSTSLSVSITDSGLAALHITNIALGGSNAKDFSSSSPTCAPPISVNSTCTATVTFTPLAAGVRTGTVTLTDDAPDSPQVIDLTGNANAAFTPGPAPNGSTSASVSAGQPAQYQLQLAPGSSFTGTVSLSCTGAPLGALCQVPSTLSLANGAAMPFTATVTTSGPALAPPSAPIRFSRSPRAPALPFVMLALLLAFLVDHHRGSARTATRVRFALAGILAVAIFSLAFGVAGCGGGSSVAPPPPTVTPSGTYMLTINFSANSSSGQPLQLSPLQLTLKVN